MVTRVARYLPEHNGIPQHNGMPQRSGIPGQKSIPGQTGIPARAGIPEQTGMPHELACHDAGGAAGHVRVVPGRLAALAADWFGGGRVEVMAAGRPLVVEHDHDGTGVRVVEPMSGLPLAGFEPAGPSGLRRAGRTGRRRRGRNGGMSPGRVHLADGTSLRWICPTRSVFECGFVRGSANIVRFAHDGTAIVCVGDDDAPSGYPGGSTAAPPDVLALVVLGWFLLLDGGWPLGDDAGELAGGAAYADMPDGVGGPTVSGRVPSLTPGSPARPRVGVRGRAVAQPAPPVR